MTYASPYQKFIFDSYHYESSSGHATFVYSFDDQRRFEEQIHLRPSESYDQTTFDRVMRLAHILIGISYYKAFPTSAVEVRSFNMTETDARFFSMIYRDGLSQYVYENNLDPDQLAVFSSSQEGDTPTTYSGEGCIVLQSGGKDSILLATLLEKQGVLCDALYCSSADSYPKVIDELQFNKLYSVRRLLDRIALEQAATDGALNGHVPVTFIIMSIALIQAVLQGRTTVLMAIGQEGEEPYDHIGDYAIRHQWSKTWIAESEFARYVASRISPNLHVGSPLRAYSELRIARLFAEHCMARYGSNFSSCNVANYRQGHDNSRLSWCGRCAKCANSFLLFAPWVEPDVLIATFGHNLFASEALVADFRGLLGVDDTVKPFECVGETDELRLAYHLARERHPAAGYNLPFDVPRSTFDVDREGPSQAWAVQMIQ